MRSCVNFLFHESASTTCGGIHSEKKGRKSQFLFTAQLLGKWNLFRDFQRVQILSLTKTKKELRQAPSSLLHNVASTLTLSKEFGADCKLNFDNGKLAFGLMKVTISRRLNASLVSKIMVFDDEESTKSCCGFLRYVCFDPTIN